MNREDLKNFNRLPQSYWLASPPRPSILPREDISVDIAIIGAGMAGLLCAYLLHRENVSIAVLDAGRILCGTTGHTTAKITSQHGLIYDKMKRQLGPNLQNSMPMQMKRP